MLKLVNVKKDYQLAGSVVPALKGVSLCFRANEFVSILGASGCGKTTLLNIIGGLDHYTSGDLIIGGISTKDYTDRDWDVYRNHRIGFVFQSYNLIPHQTVLGNVELALTIAGLGKEERRKRAKEALEKVGLADELNKRPNQLSGGQMQRVAIARALVNNPEILLADEPTGALDSTTSIQIMELIREIAGERLVIMVTHNPELAEQYSSRIVRLSDGLVVSDSNPHEIADATVLEETSQEQTKAKAKGKKKDKTDVKEKASMSFGTALTLSGRNLYAKKARTTVTSIAGSIGIVGVSLVLALSGGFNAYIAKTEKDMLSAYPLTVQERTMSFSSIMESMTSLGNKVDLDRLDDRIYVDSYLSKLANGMMSFNTITQEYLDHLETLDKNSYYAMQYSYGGTVSNNIFKEFAIPSMSGSGASAVAGGAQGSGAPTMPTITKTELSLTAIQDAYSAMSQAMGNQGGDSSDGEDSESSSSSENYDSISRIISTMQESIYEMPDSPEYILSQYDEVYGKLPASDSTDQLTLIINKDGSMTDVILAQLGLITMEEFMGYLGTDSSALEEITFEKLVSQTFTYYPNNSVYQKYPTADSATWKRASLSLEGLPYGQLSNGKTLTIACILRAKDDVTYGSLSSGLAYTKGFADLYRADSMASDFVKAYNTTSADAEMTVYHDDYSGSTSNMMLTQKVSLRQAGGAEMPNTIKIYAKDFDNKDIITAHLDKWNDEIKANDESAKIEYTDTLAILMTLVRSMLDAVTYVLVAFTAISLVVSSVMIGVITYVSVVERTKEIGVLRSLGARKSDIRNLFNAETFIIGLLSGVFGVGVTYLLSLPINAILDSLTGIATLAALPWWQAIIMVVISVVLTLVSGLIPAQSAAKKDPVIALRTE